MADNPRGQVLQPNALIDALVQHEVRFVIVGGFAVAAHGHVRATKDIDICPDPEPSNLARLAAALIELEARPIGLDDMRGEFPLETDAEGLRAGGNWTLSTRFGRLDLMQHLEGLGDEGGGWTELSRHAEARRFVGHDCLFCGYDDLIRMKKAADRPQDRIDLKNLKAARSQL